MIVIVTRVLNYVYNTSEAYIADRAHWETEMVNESMTMKTVVLHEHLVEGS